MEITLEDRLLNILFFLKLNIISPSVHPMGFLPCLRHPTAWCKGPVASRCSLDFCSLSAPVIAHEQASGLPPLPPGQAAVPWDLIPHCLFSTCPFSLVTSPGLSQQDTEAGVSSSVLACWENCTPALRTGLSQPRRKVGCCQVRQLRHHLGSQEAQGTQGEPGILPFGQLYLPDSHCKIHKDQQISPEWLISLELVFSDVRTALSIIPLFFNHL